MSCAANFVFLCLCVILIGDNVNAANTIKSFVFFDTEATGLPKPNDVPSMTELSLVACSREHLLQAEKGKLPRALQKLLLVFNPMKPIDPYAVKITGLTNELLKNVKEWNNNTVDMLSSFMKQLEKPIALVAHNGNYFDYPLLNVYLKKMRRSLEMDLLCVDTIPVFRQIDRQLGIQCSNYTQTGLYKRFYGHEPKTAHNAEADALTLLLCAIATNKMFVQTADAMAVNFAATKFSF